MLFASICLFYNVSPRNKFFIVEMELIRIVLTMYKDSIFQISFVSLKHSSMYRFEGIHIFYVPGQIGFDIDKYTTLCNPRLIFQLNTMSWLYA